MNLSPSKLARNRGVEPWILRSWIRHSTQHLTSNIDVAHCSIVDSIFTLKYEAT